MASVAMRTARTPAALTRAVWPALVVASGLAVGVTATLDWITAIILAAALALTPLVLLFPPLMASLLVVTVFTQVLSVGGLTISRIVAPLALFVVLVALLRGGYALRTGPPLGWVCGYALWALASGLWTLHLGDTISSLSSLAIALTYMVAFAVLLRSRQDLDRVLYTLAVVALVAGVLGIFTNQGRAEGASGNPNFFAMVEIFALPLVLVLATQVRGRVARIGLYAVVLVIVLSVFSSLSRGGFLTLLSVAAATLILPARTFFQSPAHKAFVLAVVAAGTFIAFRAEAGSLAPRLESIYGAAGSQDQTGAGRTNVWRGAWTSIKERPVLGLGYGSFISEANELMLRTPGVNLKNMTLRNNGLYAHNAYIETAAEVGIPGLIFFLGILVSTFRALRRAASRAGAVGATFLMRIAYALLVSLVSWSIASFFASSETSRPIWILIGVTLALPKLIEEHERLASGTSTDA
jgi:putative inorganic carbon (HCO3(-)) transporter